MVLGPHHPVFRRHPADEPSGGGGPDGRGDEPLLPEALRQDLHALFASGPAIPESIDRAVLADARFALSRSRHRVIFTFRRAAAALATAAVLGLAVLIAVPSRPARPGDERILAMDAKRTAADNAASRRANLPVPAATPSLADRGGQPTAGGTGGLDRDAATESGRTSRSTFGGLLSPADAYRAGKATIVDALVLARAVSDPARDKADATLDITGDGRVDQRDIDAVAALAVSLTANPIRSRPAPGGPG